jgi:hypothetical protein
MTDSKTPDFPGTDVYGELLTEFGRGEVLAQQLHDLSSALNRQANSSWKRTDEV